MFLPVRTKKRSAFPAERFVRTANALINLNKVRITRADHPFRINETVYVNRDPAAVHEHEFVADEPEMAFSVSLDEELFRMPPETEHLAMTHLNSSLFMVVV